MCNTRSGFDLSTIAARFTPQPDVMTPALYINPLRLFVSVAKLSPISDQHFSVFICVAALLLEFRYAVPDLPRPTDKWSVGEC